MDNRAKSKKELIQELEDVRYKLSALSIGDAQTSAYFLQSLIDAIPNPIFYKDAEGIYQGCNRAFAESVLGLSMQRIVGSSVYDLPEAIPPELADVYHERDMELIHNPGVQQYEAPVQYTDGTQHHIMFNKATLTDLDGNVTGMVGVMLDVTDLRLVESQTTELLQQTQSALFEAEVLYQLSSSANAFENLPGLLQTVVNRVAELLPANRVILITFDIDRRQVKDFAKGGPGSEFVELPSFDELWDGLSGWVLREQKPALSPKDQVDPREGAEAYERRVTHKAGSIIVVPLRYRDQLLGTLTAINKLEQPDFSERDVDLMMAMAAQASSAVYNARIFEELEQRAERTEAAAAVSEAASSILDLDELLLMAVDLIKEQFDLYYVGIFLIDQERHWVGLRAGTGEPGRVMLENRHGFEVGSSSMIGQCVARGEPRIPERVEDAVRYVNPLLPDTTAEIALPLISRGEVIGAMSVQSDSVRVFSRSDITVLQTMAGQIGNAIQNAQLFEEAQESLTETQMMYDFSRTVNEAQSVEQILQAAADIAAFMNLDVVSIRLFTHWDEDGTPLTLDAYAIALAEQDRDIQKIHNMNFDKSVLDWFDDLRKIYVFEDITSDQSALPEGVRQSLTARGYISMITAALSSGGQRLGQLAFYGEHPIMDLPQHYIELTRTVVDQVAGALYTRYLLEENERRAQRQQTAAEVSRAASSIVDQDALLAETVELIRDRFALYYAGIFLIDDSGRWAVLRAGTGEPGRKMLELGHRLEVGGRSMIGTCVATGDAVVRLDVGKAAVRFDNPHLPDTRSEMALPLSSRGQVIGAMTIQSAEVAAYSQSDIVILQTMADQLANAIVNARLIAESEANLEELQRLQRHYAVDMWEDYIQRQDVLGYMYDLNQVVPLSSLELAQTFAQDMLAQPHFQDKVSVEGGDGAALMARLEIKGEPVGTLRFEDPDAAPTWTEDDVAILDSVRQQIELALENRMLLDQSQNALRETRLREEEGRFLQQVAAFLNATEDIVSAQQELLAQIQDFMPVDRIALIGYNARSGELKFLGDQPDNILSQNGEGFEDLQTDTGFAWCVDQDAPLILSDIREEQHFRENNVLSAAGVLSRALFPLKLGLRTLGVLSLESQEVAAFSRSGLLNVLLQVSAQVASAIERADLLRQARASAGESRTLYEATRELAQATTYDTVLRAIIEHTILYESARAEICLFVVDPGTGASHDWLEILATWSSGAELESLELGLRVPASEFPVLDLMGLEHVQGQYLPGDSITLLVCEDVVEDPDMAPEVKQAFLDQGVRAIVATPLIFDYKTIGGVLQIRFSEPYHPTEQDRRLYRTTSEQAAVVISNRRLLERSEAQAEQLSAAVDLANVTTALSDRSALLSDSVEFFKERFDLYFAGIYLLDSDGQWAVLQAGSGSEGENLLRMGHRLQTGGDSRIGQCVARLSRYIALDVSKDPYHFENPLLPDTRSAIVLPLISRGQLIGALSIQSKMRFAFTQEQISTLELMATQLANVIESANLYQRSQSSLAETRMLYRISQQITDARTEEDVLRAAVDGLSQREEPDWISAGLLVPSGNPNELRLDVTWSRGGGTEPLGALPLTNIRLFYDLLSSDERFVTPDITQEPIVDEYVREFFNEHRLRATAAFPLAVRGAQYGVLMVHSWKSREFSTSELRFYAGVARQASVALENISLVATTREEADRRAFLNEVLQTASSELEPIALLRGVGKVISKGMHRPVMMWSWTGRFARPVAIFTAEGTSVNGDKDPPSFLPSEVPMIHQSIERRVSMSIDFKKRKEGLMLRSISTLETPLQQAYVVPLTARDRVFGVLLLGRREGHTSFSEQEIETINTASINISVALETASLYQDAQETAEKLQEVDNLKSQFMANMSHELRTPLNSIIGFSRVILKGIDGPLTDMQQTDLTAIYESGTQLLNLINDILDISKIEAGKMEFSFESTDLKELVKSVMLVSTALVKDKSVQLQTDVPDDLPMIKSDSRRVRQVLTNLLSNAAKFTEEGFIRVSATYDNYQVIMMVQDTGIGIPPDRLSAVFERFEQVDSSSTRSYGGTGIGMPLSLEFVKAHGGDMWLESEVGGGSKFYFSLPIDGPTSRSPEEEEEEKVTSEDRIKSPTSRVILAVDDEEDTITLFRRFLEKQGYVVFGLTDSARVRQEARRLKPYAITLDVIMPGKDGWQVIKELQEDPETRDIPVIVCSIKSETEKGFSLGISDYLVKPIMEQDLLDALARLDQLKDEGYILVVDDNPDDRQLLQRILRNAGYSVIQAAGGSEAIDKIHIDPPSLVVLDLMMPEVDGFDVLENLKSDPATRRIPVVVVTAKELTSTENQALQQGVEALLQKGIFDQEQLLRDVSAALDALRKGSR